MNRSPSSGQTMILMVLSIGIVMSTVALFSLQHAGQASRSALRGSKREEIRPALESAVLLASHLFRYEASCDPVVLNELLSRVKPDGTLVASGDPATHRYLTVDMAPAPVQVVLGPVRTLIPSDPDKKGTSQDAVIEVWTKFQDQRASLQAALLNNCSYPCSKVSASGEGVCNVAADGAIAYHRITAPASFPASGVGVALCMGGGRFSGDLENSSVSTGGDPNCGSPASAGVIDAMDLWLLRNHLRSGTLSGSCASIYRGTAGDSCADFNHDGLVNEYDLNLLEKALRGYLNYLVI